MKKFMMAMMFVMATAVLAEGNLPKLNGYCPVAYVAMNKAIKGDEKYTSTYNNSKWLFVNADAKNMYDKDPNKFEKAIQFQSYCATGVALGKKIVADPLQFLKIGENVYFFSSADAKAIFEKDQKGMLGKANANWAKAKGNPSNLN